MSERVDKFCAALQNQLNDLERRMESLKTSIRSAPQQAEDALHKQIDQVRHQVQSQQQAVAKAKASVKDWAEQKKAEAKATIDQWKAEHEARKLEDRAERAEEYATSAIRVAMLSIDEAEEAAFEAIAARRDADAVTVG